MADSNDVGTPPASEADDGKRGGPPPSPKIEEVRVVIEERMKDVVDVVETFDVPSAWPLESIKSLASQEESLSLH